MARTKERVPAPRAQVLVRQQPQDAVLVVEGDFQIQPRRRAVESDRRASQGCDEEGVQRVVDRSREGSRAVQVRRQRRSADAASDQAHVVRQVAQRVPRAHSKKRSPREMRETHHATLALGRVPSLGALHARQAGTKGDVRARVGDSEASAHAHRVVLVEERVSRPRAHATRVPVDSQLADRARASNVEERRRRAGGHATQVRTRHRAVADARRRGRVRALVRDGG